MAVMPRGLNNRQSTVHRMRVTKRRPMLRVNCKGARRVPPSRRGPR